MKIANSLETVSHFKKPYQLIVSNTKSLNVAFTEPDLFLIRHLTNKILFKKCLRDFFFSLNRGRRTQTQIKDRIQGSGKYIQRYSPRDKASGSQGHFLERNIKKRFQIFSRRVCVSKFRSQQFFVWLGSETKKPTTLFRY